jgi:hypothetical protein
VAARAALSPYDHDHSVIEETGTDPANLAVVKPVIEDSHRLAGKYLFGIDREIEAPMRKSPIALGGVEGRLHAQLGNYIIRIASSIM